MVFANGEPQVELVWLGDFCDIPAGQKKTRIDEVVGHLEFDDEGVRLAHNHFDYLSPWDPAVYRRSLLRLLLRSEDPRSIPVSSGPRSDGPPNVSQ